MAPSPHPGINPCMSNSLLPVSTVSERTSKIHESSPCCSLDEQERKHRTSFLHHTTLSSRSVWFKMGTLLPHGGGLGESKHLQIILWSRMKKSPKATLLNLSGSWCQNYKGNIIVSIGISLSELLVCHHCTCRQSVSDDTSQRKISPIFRYNSPVSSKFFSVFWKLCVLQLPYCSNS